LQRNRFAGQILSETLLVGKEISELIARGGSQAKSKKGR
jgi:hypothetical protein